MTYKQSSQVYNFSQYFLIALKLLTLISRNNESLEAFFKKFIDSFTVGEIEAQEKETQGKQKQAVSQ